MAEISKFAATQRRHCFVNSGGVKPFSGDQRFRLEGIRIANLAKMNLAVNGLRGEIKKANTYYDDAYGSFGAFDYVLANPPFNVDVSLSSVEKDKRFNTYGIPRNKSKLKKSDLGKQTYMLFFNEIGTRRVCLGGITRHPDADWMEQVARNATMQDTGYLNGGRYLLHDRDQKFCRQFRETLAAGGVKCLPLPARSPNLNAYAERWVRSIKEEYLSKLILFGEKSLQQVVSNYLKH
jgi:N-6 DNA Methylase